MTWLYLVVMIFSALTLYFTYGEYKQNRFLVITHEYSWQNRLFLTFIAYICILYIEKMHALF